MTRKLENKRTRSEWEHETRNASSNSASNSSLNSNVIDTNSICASSEKVEIVVVDLKTYVVPFKAWYKENIDSLFVNTSTSSLTKSVVLPVFEETATYSPVLQRIAYFSKRAAKAQMKGEAVCTNQSEPSYPSFIRCVNGHSRSVNSIPGGVKVHPPFSICTVQTTFLSDGSSVRIPLLMDTVQVHPMIKFNINVSGNYHPTPLSVEDAWDCKVALDRLIDPVKSGLTAFDMIDFFPGSVIE